MSAAIPPGCDSDEDVFWGPITARELELDWRRLKAKKDRLQKLEEGNTFKPNEEQVVPPAVDVLNSNNTDPQNFDGNCSTRSNSSLILSKARRNPACEALNECNTSAMIHEDSVLSTDISLSIDPNINISHSNDQQHFEECSLDDMKTMMKLNDPRPLEETIDADNMSHDLTKKSSMSINKSILNITRDISNPEMEIGNNATHTPRRNQRRYLESTVVINDSDNYTRNEPSSFGCTEFTHGIVKVEVNDELPFNCSKQEVFSNTDVVISGSDISSSINGPSSFTSGMDLYATKEVKSEDKVHLNRTDQQILLNASAVANISDVDSINGARSLEHVVVENVKEKLKFEDKDCFEQPILSNTSISVNSSDAPLITGPSSLDSITAVCDAGKAKIEDMDLEQQVILNTSATVSSSDICTINTPSSLTYANGVRATEEMKFEEKDPVNHAEQQILLNTSAMATETFKIEGTNLVNCTGQQGIHNTSGAVSGCDVDSINNSCPLDYAMVDTEEGECEYKDPVHCPEQQFPYSNSAGVSESDISSINGPGSLDKPTDVPTTETFKIENMDSANSGQQVLHNTSAAVSGSEICSTNNFGSMDGAMVERNTEEVKFGDTDTVNCSQQELTNISVASCYSDNNSINGSSSAWRDMSQQDPENVKIDNNLPVSTNSEYQVICQGPLPESINELKTKVESMDLSYDETNNAQKIPSDVTSSPIVNKASEEMADSSDLSFVSLMDEKEMPCDASEENSAYIPPDKRQKCESEEKKQKDVEPTKVKSKIPTAGISKLPILKPSALKVERYVADSVWASDFMRKKVPKPRKPDYVVSPAKLGGLLKSMPAHLQQRPQSAGSSLQKPPSTPLQSTNRIFNTPNIMVKPSSAQSKLRTPTSIPKSTEKIKKGTPAFPVSPSKSLKFKDVASPVANYINTGKPVIIRNVTPRKPGLEIHQRNTNNTNAENTPPKPVTSRLPEKYYTSASKVMLHSSPKRSPAHIKLGERQAAVLVTPKPHVFKHNERVQSSEKKHHGSPVLDRVKPYRKTSLSNTSFANLPVSENDDLDMSVIEQK